jgi:UDP-2,4-diacetamido-2,4,6-trideoxy-beta-L-altropyranose hydrolase
MSESAAASSNPALGVCFRVDASAQMGTGHLKRCLFLAEGLTRAGASVCFVVRAIDAAATRVLADCAFDVRWLPEPPRVGGADSAHCVDPSSRAAHREWSGVTWEVDVRETVAAVGSRRFDWLVLDHYSFDARWHRAAQQALGGKLLVIDDLGDRPIAADVLVDPNWAEDHGRKYAAELTRPLALLGGPAYALLSARYRETGSYVFSDPVRSIGIFMGGADPQGASAKALRACRTANWKGAIEIVSTQANPSLQALSDACAADGAAALSLDMPDLAAFFCRHDIQIGAGGGASWERCFAGAPTIAVELADNQRAVLPGLAALGAIKLVELQALAHAVHEVIDDAAQRAALAAKARALVDGRGVQRVAAVMHAACGIGLQIRPATAGDETLLLEWANEPETRRNAFNPEPIAAGDHHRWFQARLSTPESCCIWIIEALEFPAALVRFDKRGGFWEISYSVDSGFRRLGLGARALALALDAMRAREPGFSFVRARVMLHNQASLKVFEKLGFLGQRLIDERGEHWLFTKSFASGTTVI